MVQQVDPASGPTYSGPPFLVTQIARIWPATLILFLFFPEMARAQPLAPFIDSGAIAWGESFGVFAIGWGVGVTGWLVTGHQAVSCLFVDVPRAWKLWQKKILTSGLPIYKYLIGGGLLLLLGTVLVDQLWGIWTQAFDVGMVAGVVVGVWFSFMKAREFRNEIDFLEANQRFLNENKVSLFTEYERP
jgi:hypothetical protein